MRAVTPVSTGECASSQHAPDPGHDCARILIVDDSAEVRATLHRILTGAGHAPVTVESGEEALEHFGANRFDAVVSDIQLPGMCGTELLREIRRRSQGMPVILVTGHPDVDTAIAAVEHQAFRYLTKPFRVREFLDVVGRALAHRKIARVHEEVEALVPEIEEADGLDVRFVRALETMWFAYQPIIDRNWTIVGFEALLRCEESELRGPLDFLAAAEELGRVDELATRIRQAVTRPFERRTEMLFMNVDPSQLKGEALAMEENIFRSMSDRIVLEITERASAENIHGFEEKLWELKEAGFKLAVDDMGTGYSGLTLFSQFDPEFVKLDGALIRGVQRSDRKQKIIASLANLCLDLGINAVAEGVETQEEFEVLREMGCTHFQGFFVGRPAPLD